MSRTIEIRNKRVAPGKFDPPTSMSAFFSIEKNRYHATCGRSYLFHFSQDRRKICPVSKRLTKHDEGISVSINLDEFEQTYQEDRFLFTEEGRGDKFYIVQNGQVDLIKNLEGGGTSLIASLGPGAIFGEMALVEQSKRSTSAIAQTETTCLEFDEEQFEQLLKTNKSFRDRLLNLLSKRLRNTTSELAEVLNYRNKIYQCLIILLSFIHREDWFDRSQKEIRTDLPIEKIAAYFRIPSRKLKMILDHPDPKELQEEIGLEEKDSLLNTAEELLDDIIDMARFVGEEELDSDQPELAEEDLTGTDLTATAETLLGSLLQVDPSPNSDRLESFRSDYDSLCDAFDELDGGLDPDQEEPFRAYMNAIKHKIEPLEG